MPPVAKIHRGLMRVPNPTIAVMAVSGINVVVRAACEHECAGRVELLCRHPVTLLNDHRTRRGSAPPKPEIKRSRRLETIRRAWDGWTWGRAMAQWVPTCAFRTTSRPGD